MRAKRVLGLSALAAVWIAGCSDGSSSGTKANAGADGDAGANSADGGGSAMHPMHDSTGMNHADAGNGTSMGMGTNDPHDAAVHDPDPNTGVAGPSSHRLYYWGDFAQQNAGQLVAIDYPGGKKQVLALKGKAGIDGVGVSPDGSHVVVAQSDADGDPANLRAYTTDDWSSPVMLDSANTGEEFGDVVLSDDGSFVAYEREVASSGTTVQHAFLAPTDGSAKPVQLDMNGDIDSLSWSADGRVAFWDATALWIVDPAKPKAPKMVAVPDVVAHELAWDPQSRLYFPGAPDMSSSPRFYRVSVTGEVEMLAGSEQFDSPPGIGSFARLTISPDGKLLAFKADIGGNNYDEGYVFDLTAHEAPVRLTDLMMQGQVRRLAWRPDSAVLLLAIQWELPSGATGVTGSLVLAPHHGDTIQIDAPETAYQIEAEDLTYSPDGSRLYFRADGRTEGAMELFMLNDLEHPPADPFAMVIQDSIADGNVDGLALTH